MLYSIVIPAHNAGAYLRSQLSAIEGLQAANPFEIIVVDNQSTDDTADVARSFADRLDLKVVAATAGSSASYARNVGIAHARGEFIVFVDADDVVDSGLLAAYRRCADTYRIMGGAYDESRLNAASVAAWRFELTSEGLPVAYETMPYFLMGNVAIHRTVFEDIGTFDEALTHGGEEVDFSIRATLAGYEIGWVPDAIVYYRHRTTLRGLARQFYDYGRASVFVYVRYRESVGLPRTTLKHTGQVFWEIVPRAVNVLRGPARRGHWVRITSYYAGELAEGARRRVWYLS